MLHRRNSNSAGEHVEAEQAARASRASKEKADRLEAAREKQQQQQNVGPHIEWGRGGVSAAFSEEVEGACARASGAPPEAFHPLAQQLFARREAAPPFDHHLVLVFSEKEAGRGESLARAQATSSPSASTPPPPDILRQDAHTTDCPSMHAVNGEASPENRRNTPSKSKGHVEVGGHAKAPPPRSLGWGPDSTHVAPTSPSLEATPAVAPYPIGEELTQSVQFLSEALKSERKRSDELEARRLQLEEANAALRAELRAAQDKAFQAMVRSRAPAPCPYRSRRPCVGPPSRDDSSLMRRRMNA